MFIETVESCAIGKDDLYRLVKESGDVGGDAPGSNFAVNDPGDGLLLYPQILGNIPQQHSSTPQTRFDILWMHEIDL